MHTQVADLRRRRSPVGDYSQAPIVGVVVSVIVISAAFANLANASELLQQRLDLLVEVDVVNR
jgi:hypothetical protein